MLWGDFLYTWEYFLYMYFFFQPTVHALGDFLYTQDLLHNYHIFQPIVHAVGDPFYKITSEALLVTQQLVKVIRPLGMY